jgi:hypothetical protein
VDGDVREIEVPSWWNGVPWEEAPLPRGVFVRENAAIDAADHRRIKRIVLLYDQTLEASEIEDVGVPQYAGVQLLRGQQWIETLGTRERFADLVPPDRRDGFRGFVEFDRHVEGELREVESPQHDGFERRRALVRQIDLVVGEAVRAFAEEMGWFAGEKASPKDDTAADDLLKQITEMFVVSGPKTGQGREEGWKCELDVEFPDSNSVRVDWGEKLRYIDAVCRHEVLAERRDIRFDLVVIDPLGNRTLFGSRTRRSSSGSAGADFPDVTISKVSTGADNEAVCPMPGRLRLRCECFFEDVRVATATRNVYVHADPPDPITERPIAVELGVQNADANRARVNSGEHISVSIAVKNRSSSAHEITVDASVGELLFYDGHPAHLKARAAGDVPSAIELRTDSIEVRTDVPTDSAQTRVRLEPGKHAVRVDVRENSGDVIASATRALWVEIDPEDGGPELPFRIEPRDELRPLPVWELTAPHGQEADWVLEYTRTHPAYRAALAADVARSNGQLVGRRFFYGEMICAGLIEWALMLYRENGDESGFQLLLERAGDESGQVWEAYRTKLEELQDCDSEVDVMRLQRAVVSLMLYAVAGGSTAVAV